MARTSDSLQEPSPAGALALTNDLLAMPLSGPLSESREPLGAMHQTLALRVKDYIN